MKRFKRQWMTGLGAVLLASALTVTAWAAERLDTVSDTYWDENTVTMARWDEVDDAYQYEVYLYRDESKVTEKTTSLSVKLMVKAALRRPSRVRSSPPLRLTPPTWRLVTEPFSVCWMLVNQLEGVPDRLAVG